MSHPTDPPTADTPTPADTQAEIDYRKRYEDLQPEYTRTTQELARLRRIEAGEDPDGLKAMLERYGLEMPDDTEDLEPDEPEGDVEEFEEEPQDDPRLTRFEQFIEQQEQQQYNQAVQEQWDGWAQYVVEQAKEAGVELRGRELKGLQIDCMGQDGMPLPPGPAKKVLDDYLKEREAWIEELAPKGRRARVPHVPASGQPETGGKDPADMTLEEKNAMAISRLTAEQA